MLVTNNNVWKRIRQGDVTYNNAYILTSIPKEIDDWINPNTGEKQAYKFVSKIYEI